MSDSGSPAGNGPRGFFDDVLPNPQSGLPAPTPELSYANPGWETGPVFTQEQLDEVRRSPEMAALGIDLTQPPPDYLAGTGLVPDHANFDFGAWNKAMAMESPRQGPSLDSSTVQPAPADAGPGANSEPQPSWSPDQVNRQLLDNLENSPLPSLGGYGADGPPAPGPQAGSAAPDDQTVGSGHITVKAPDPESFAPAVHGLLDIVANQPLPGLAGTIQRKKPEGKYNIFNIDSYKTDPTFDPAFADRLTAAFQEMNANGITPGITKGTRSAVEQKKLKDKATPSGNPVASVSWHQVGQAVDMNHRDPNFEQIKQIMLKHGFVWGGPFQPKSDPVHFQLAPRGTSPTPEMLQAYGGN